MFEVLHEGCTYLKDRLNAMRVSLGIIRRTKAVGAIED